MDGASETHENFQTVQVPVVLQDLPAAVTLHQACQALSTLQNASEEIFSDLLQRIADQTEVLDKLNRRLKLAEEKVHGLQSQSEEVLLTCSSRYPTASHTHAGAKLINECNNIRKEFHSAAAALHETTYLTKLQGRESAELFHFFKQASVPPNHPQQDCTGTFGRAATADGLLFFNNKHAVRNSFQATKQTPDTVGKDPAVTPEPLAVAAMQQSHAPSFRPFTSPLRPPNAHTHTPVLATAPKLYSNLPLPDLPTVNNLNHIQISSVPASRASTPHKLSSAHRLDGDHLHPGDHLQSQDCPSKAETLEAEEPMAEGGPISAANSEFHTPRTAVHLAGDGRHEAASGFAAPADSSSPGPSTWGGDTKQMPPLPPVFSPGHDVLLSVRPSDSTPPGSGHFQGGSEHRELPKEATPDPRIALPSLPVQIDGKGTPLGDAQLHATPGSAAPMRALSSFKGSASFDSTSGTPTKDDFVNDLTKSLTHRQRSLTSNLSINMSLVDLGHDPADDVDVSFSRDASNASSFEDGEYQDATAMGGLHTFLHKSGEQH